MVMMMIMLMMMMNVGSTNANNVLSLNKTIV